MIYSISKPTTAFRTKKPNKVILSRINNSHNRKRYWNKSSGDEVPNASTKRIRSNEEKESRIVEVVYAFNGKKKKKQWMDGTLSIVGKEFLINDEKGKNVHKSRVSRLKEQNKDISDDDIVLIGNYLVDVSSDRSIISVCINVELEENPIPKLQIAGLVGGNGKRKRNAGIQVSSVKRGPSSASGAIPKLTSLLQIHSNIMRFLRPHQISGVDFMYDNIIRNCGCVVGDEMGLGKTLMCLALVYSLFNKGSRRVKKRGKVLLLVPSTLVKNWENEIAKWFGLTLPHLVVSGDHKKQASINAIKLFSVNGKYNLMIISYDQMALLSDHFNKDKPFLLICDEGHRLKNPNTNVYRAVSSFTTQRRIVLSGTPLQNDLSELFTLFGFTNPGLLGRLEEFQSEFVDVIASGRKDSSNEMQKALARERSLALSRIIKNYFLRRTTKCIARFIPNRRDYILFCRPSQLQRKMYQRLVNSVNFDELGSGVRALTLIFKLRQIASHPALVKEETTGFHGAGNMGSVSNSGKMILLDRLLERIEESTEDKIIIVSNFTSSLDIIEVLCGSRGYTFSRIDGTVSLSNRSRILSEFSKEDSPLQILLLSAKVGGIGLNLVSSNRLILFDMEWNPAYAEQAFGRIYREGQVKESYTYSLVTAGTIEEKILQRGFFKTDLAGTILDKKGISNSTNTEELKTLFSFTYYEKGCDTIEQHANEGPGGITEVPDWDIVDENALDDSSMVKDVWNSICAALSRDMAVVEGLETHNSQDDDLIL